MKWIMTVHTDFDGAQGWKAVSLDPSSLFAWLESNLDVFEGRRITLVRMQEGAEA